MITIYIINAILIAHFISDFFFQNILLADKNESLFWMFVHSVIYTFFFGFIFYVATYTHYEPSLVIQYIALNGVLHYAVDVVTGFIKTQQLKKEYEKMEDNGFYCNVGFDQLLHLLILFHTYVYMFN